MSWWIIFPIIIIYFLIEFITGIFFNWRLILLSEKKFTKAGGFAALSTTLFISSVIVATWFGIDGDVSAFWLIPFVALSMGAGNFVAAITVPKIRELIHNRKNKKDK